MSRDELKKILGENATDEQISSTLNLFHASEKAKNDEIANLKSQNAKYSDYDDIKKQLDAINQANLTEQEKLEQQKQEIAKNLKESRITKNKAKVMTELAGYDIDDEIIDSLVGEDETISVNKAKKLVAKLTALKEDTVKKTKEELANVNIKPNIENSNLNNDVMTKEKFEKLTFAEQKAFKDANLDTYHSWYK